MSGADTGEAAGFCANLVRGCDFARYAATLFVPADRRRALLALYAFNAEISRVREQVTQPLPGEIRLQWWTDALTGVGHSMAYGSNTYKGSCADFPQAPINSNKQAIVNVPRCPSASGGHPPACCALKSVTKSSV